MSNTTYTTKRAVQLRAHMLRTLCFSQPWNRDGFMLAFDSDPSDSVTICRKGTDETCLFGLRADDPFLTTGVTLEEAEWVVQRYLDLIAEEKRNLN